MDFQAVIYVAMAFLGGAAYVFWTRTFWLSQIETVRYLVLAAIAGLLCYFITPGGGRDQLIIAFGAGGTAPEFIRGILFRRELMKLVRSETE